MCAVQVETDMLKSNDLWRQVTELKKAVGERKASPLCVSVQKTIPDGGCRTGYAPLSSQLRDRLTRAPGACLPQRRVDIATAVVT